MGFWPASTLVNLNGGGRNRTARICISGSEVQTLRLGPVSTRLCVMKRRRHFKPEITLQDRIVEWAKQVRAQAAALPPGPDRDELLRKVRYAETAMHLEDWANSPGLQPPK